MLREDFPQLCPLDDNASSCTDSNAVTSTPDINNKSDSHTKKRKKSCVVDIELDTSTLTAYARASLECLVDLHTSQQESINSASTSATASSNRCVPKWKRARCRRRGAVHVSEQQIVEGMIATVDNSLKISNSPSQQVKNSNRTKDENKQRIITGGKSLKSATSSMSCCQVRPKFLLVYFDLNETILVSDKVANSTIDECLNKGISRNAFLCESSIQDLNIEKLKWHNGMSLDDAKTVYAKALTHSTMNSAKSGLSASVSLSSSAIPFSPSFVQSIPSTPVPLLYQGTHTSAGFISCFDAVTKYPSIRIPVKNFTDDGNLGSMYRSQFLELRDQLRWTYTCPKQVQDMFTDSSGKYHYVLPSFFHSLCQLAYAAKKTQAARRQSSVSPGTSSEFDFRPVFRTFGIDIPQLVAAVNAFADGLHPGFYPKDSLTLPHESYKRSILTRLELKRFHMPKTAGRWYCHRGGRASSDKSQRSGDPDATNLTPMLCQYSSIPDSPRCPPNPDDAVCTVKGNRAIFDMLCSHQNNGDDVKSRAVTPIGIRDDYFAWHGHHYLTKAGKPAWYNSNRKMAALYDMEVVTIFFDDHINNLDVSCVMPCDCSKSLTLQSCKKGSPCHLLRVDLVRAIRENNYFYKEVIKCFSSGAAYFDAQQGP